MKVYFVFRSHIFYHGKITELKNRKIPSNISISLSISNIGCYDCYACPDSQTFRIDADWPNCRITHISKDTLNNGLNVIIDIQMCSWRNARNAIQLVYDQLNNVNIKLYAVRADVLLNNCTKLQQYSDVSNFHHMQTSSAEFLLYTPFKHCVFFARQRFAPNYGYRNFSAAQSCRKNWVVH